ncbi:MAG: hypothetical protein LLG42_07130, partial [Chloroflexi bacterium]|nr:hypothetical protein [Chloroflexota bacterium]
MKQNKRRNKIEISIAVVLALLLGVFSYWVVSAHEAHPTSGNPHAPAHNENASPGFVYNGWIAPYTGYFSIYEQGGISQIRFTVTLTRVGSGSGGGTYQAVWNPSTSGLNRFDTPIRINAGEKYNITVYEQEQESGHSGWYEAEGWLPPRVVNLGGSDIECGIGNHPFNSIMVAMGGSARFLTWNVFNVYKSVLNDLIARNPAVTSENAASALIKPTSVAWGDNSLGIQCWGDNAQFDGDWVYHGTAYSDDIDFEDFMMIWAFNPISLSVPTVQVKINSSNSDYTANEPASYTVSWSSSNVTTCAGSGGLAGQTQLNGQITVSGQAAGAVAYTMSCSNGMTAVSDTRQAIIYAFPAIDVKVDGANTPSNYVAQASYTVSWIASGGSVNCTGSAGLSGKSVLTGSLRLSGMRAGTYPYTMTCNNGHGAVASDSVTATVVNPPTVDLKVNNLDGPLTFVSPANFTLSWISQDAASCSATSSDGSWTGNVTLAGNHLLQGVATETYTYTITCSNQQRSASDSVTVVVVPPLSGTISVTYAKLLLYGPTLEQPAQTLTGNVSNGVPPYSILVWVRDPSGNFLSIARSGSTWSITP